MTSRSTSLEPKSQFTINLALKRKQKKGEKRRKFLIKRIGRKQKEKIPNQIGGESKKERKFPDQRLRERKKKKRKFPIKEEICRKVLGPDNILTTQNCHQVNEKKERKPRPQVALSL